MSSWNEEPAPGEVRIVESVSLEDVSVSASHIWYSSQTCWWTHNEGDLARHPESELPCDPRGGVLFITDDPVNGFLRAARHNADRYGEFGLRTFMAAHHRNCQRLWKGAWYPWCFRTWEKYEEILRE